MAVVLNRIKLAALLAKKNIVYRGVLEEDSFENQNIKDESFDEQYKKKAECEKIHGHIKDVVKFDIQRIRNESKKLYSLLNSIASQLLVLTELQNKVRNKNSFGR